MAENKAQGVTANGLTTGLRPVTSDFCHPWPCAPQHVHKRLGCRARRETKQVGNDATLGGVFQPFEGRDHLQEDLDELETWAITNHVKFNKGKEQ